MTHDPYKAIGYFGVVLNALYSVTILTLVVETSSGPPRISKSSFKLETSLSNRTGVCIEFLLMEVIVDQTEVRDYSKYDAASGSSKSGLQGAEPTVFLLLLRIN